jgi:hypothetical protein
MRRTALVFVLSVAVALFALAPAAGATIHPIVESADCASAQADAHHPLGDVADPRGQTPGATPGQGQNALRAVNVANDSAFSEHKNNGECGP